MRRTMRRVSLSLLCAVAVLGAAWAATAEKMPAWIGGSSILYPADAFVTAVGIGEDLDSACGNARAEVAQRLLTQGAFSGGSLPGTISRALSGKIEIPYTWHDRRNDIQYAFAVLEKARLRSLLLVEISQADEKIQGLLAAEEASPPPLDQIRVAGRLLQAIGIRSAFRALQETAGEERAVPSLGGIRADAERRLKAAWEQVVFVVPAGGAPAPLREAIVKHLENMGFRTVASVSPFVDEGAVVPVEASGGVIPDPAGSGQEVWRMKVSAGGEKAFLALEQQSARFAPFDRKGREKAMHEAGRELAVLFREELQRYLLGEGQ